MEITVRQEQARVPVTVMAMSGDLTAETAGEFKAQAEGAIARGAHYLLLDLSSVPYIASFGIRALSDVLKLVHEAGAGQTEAELRQALRDGRAKSAHLKLLKPNAQVQKVLETTGMDMLLASYPNLRDALASFQGTP